MNNAVIIQIMSISVSRSIPHLSYPVFTTHNVPFSIHLGSPILPKVQQAYSFSFEAFITFNFQTQALPHTKLNAFLSAHLMGMSYQIRNRVSKKDINGIAWMLDQTLRLFNHCPNLF